MNGKLAMSKDEAELEQLLEWRQDAANEMRTTLPGLDRTNGHWVEARMAEIREKHKAKAMAAIAAYAERQSLLARIDEMFINRIGGVNYSEQEKAEVQRSIVWGDFDRKRLAELTAQLNTLEKGDDHE